MEQEKTLQVIFEEALEQKNLNQDKLSMITEIPKRYILAIQNTELNKLPSAPYVRGYLKKICEVLGLNFPEMWEIYKKELSHKTSGAFDKLPINRFAIHRLNRKSAITATVGMVIFIFLAMNFNKFFGKPYLNIETPKDTITSTNEPVINLSGKIYVRTMS